MNDGEWRILSETHNPPVGSHGSSHPRSAAPAASLQRRTDSAVSTLLGGPPTLPLKEEYDGPPQRRAAAAQIAKGPGSPSTFRAKKHAMVRSVPGLPRSADAVTAPALLTPPPVRRCQSPATFDGASHEGPLDSLNTPPTATPHLVASSALRRVASRPRGVYTPPRWEQIGSTPATIYPRGSVQLLSCPGHCGRVRRCNRFTCCNSSLDVPGDTQKRGPAAERRWKGGERSCPAKAKGCGKRRGGRRAKCHGQYAHFDGQRPVERTRNDHCSVSAAAAVSGRQ